MTDSDNEYILACKENNDGYRERKMVKLLLSPQPPGASNRWYVRAVDANTKAYYQDGFLTKSIGDFTAEQINTYFSSASAATLPLAKATNQDGIGIAYLTCELHC